MVKPRPAWHIDAKWVCALALLGVLGLTLPVISVWRLTQKGPATNLIAYTLVGLTSPQGIDNAAGLEEFKAEVSASGSKTVIISGIPVTFTAADVNTLSPRQLRLKVFGAFADKFYSLGAKGMAESQGFSVAQAAQFQKQASAISLFTASTHRHVTNIVLALVLICLLLAGFLTYFSLHIGRLVSLGLVFLLVGLPALPLSAIARNVGIQPEGTARAATATSSLGALSGFGSYVAPLVVKYFSTTYLIILITGICLLLAALAARFLWKNPAKTYR